MSDVFLLRVIPDDATTPAMRPMIIDEGGSGELSGGLEGVSRPTARSVRDGDPLERLAGLRRVARTGAPEGPMWRRISDVEKHATTAFGHLPPWTRLFDTLGREASPHAHLFRRFFPSHAGCPGEIERAKRPSEGPKATCRAPFRSSPRRSAGTRGRMDECEWTPPKIELPGGGNSCCHLPLHSPPLSRLKGGAGVGTSVATDTW